MYNDIMSLCHFLLAGHGRTCTHIVRTILKKFTENGWWLGAILNPAYLPHVERNFVGQVNLLIQHCFVTAPKLTFEG